MNETPKGHPASDPEYHGSISGLASLMGQSLRQIHDRPIGYEPGSGRAGSGSEGKVGWEALVAMIELGEGETSDLAEPFCRYDRPRLIELWREGRPNSQDLVPSHGAARLENFYVLDGVASGWTGQVEGLVLDRHFDLAYAHRSVAAVLGNEAIYAFYEAYGTDAYLPTLEHYLLAELLLG